MKLPGPFTKPSEIAVEVPDHPAYSSMTIGLEYDDGVSRFIWAALPPFATPLKVTLLFTTRDDAEMVFQLEPKE
jgi:hypothetical protein